MLHLVQAESPSLAGVFLFDIRKLLLAPFVKLELANIGDKKGDEVHLDEKKSWR